MRRSTITTSAAIALVIQTAALTAGALWAGWRLHHFATNTITTTAATPGPSVTVTNEARPATLRIVQDLDTHPAYSPPGA